MKLLTFAPGHEVSLKDIDPDEKNGMTKADGLKRCVKNAPFINALAYRLWAENQRSLLIVLQGMDAAGKDGATRHFITAINPQMCHVFSFKQPTPEELAHDFLWRIHQCTPRHGRIAIFNRSHYEDALIVRVHGLAGTKGWSDHDWMRRYHQINHFEQTLVSAGTKIIKIFLHISKDEQLQRLQDRQADPDKHWKVSEADFEERKYWDDYQRAYEQVLTHCNTEYAPWHVVPANRKWHRDVMISEILHGTLKEMNPQFPT